jgi:hypothetical protein
VSLDDPEAVKVIYGHATEFIKAPWYWANGGIHPETGIDLFTDRDEKRHSANRRKVANAYSMTALVEMEQFVDTCSDIFMTRLGEFADSKNSFDLGHWLQCYAVFTALSFTNLPSSTSSEKSPSPNDLGFSIKEKI